MGTTHDEDEAPKLERRRGNRISDEEFDWYYRRFREKVYTEIGKKVVRGLGWILGSVAVLVLAEIASGGTISLRTAFRLIFQ